MGQVSVVMVSHSKKLVDGLIELLQPLSGGRTPLVNAGGLGDELGTSATHIANLLTAAAGDGGAVILFDLGSALMSAEMAVESLPPELKAAVRIVDTPLVEGAIAAAVEGSVGGDLEQVATAAARALGHRKILL